MSRSSKTKRRRGRAARAESPKPKRNESERALDQALEDTYPASDPLALVQPRHAPPSTTKK